jgi:hypothetical protein
MSIKVVQFLHSGKEYKLSETEKEAKRKSWNRDIIHRRKFLHAKGAYIKDGTETKENDIYFWGEWEPESIVTSIFKKPIEGAKPHFINEPVVKIQSGHVVVPINKDAHPVNTDPFVFGDKGFYYSCCMQSRYKKLQDLEPGSIILFGSNINHNKDNAYFALDTVFVVGDDKNKDNPNKQGYNINSYSKDLTKVPDNYFGIMNFEGWKDSLNSPCNSNEKNDRKGLDCTSIKSKSEGCENGSDFTCYRGASFDHRVNGMYSFVPCKIGSKGENGFERVKLTKDTFQKISKKAIISYNQCQGVKYSETNNIKDNFDFWKNLRDYIIGEGYYEAVRLDYTEEK